MISGNLNSLKPSGSLQACNGTALPDIYIYIFVWMWNTLREEHRLWVFENRVLMNIFGAKWDDITGELRKIHNEKICDVYCSTNNIWLIKPSRMRWAGNISWPLKKVPIGCPEKPVTNYHYSLRNDPEERSSHLLRCGSLKSRLTFHSLTF